MKEKILVLKNKYRGVTITRNNHQIGTLTFNTLQVPPDCYRNLYDLGFDFMFDEVVKIPDIKPKIKHSTK